jgi:hypothetical protein
MTHFWNNKTAKPNNFKIFGSNKNKGPKEDSHDSVGNHFFQTLAKMK